MTKLVTSWTAENWTTQEKNKKNKKKKKKKRSTEQHTKTNSPTVRHLQVVIEIVLLYYAPATVNNNYTKQTAARVIRFKRETVWSFYSRTVMSEL